VQSFISQVPFLPPAGLHLFCIQ